MKAQQITDKPTRSRDYSLFLDRVQKSPFDEKGTAFVRQCVTDTSMRENLSAEGLYTLVTLSQQHGLIEQSLSLLSWLNENKEMFQPAWKLHLETLQMLGKTDEFVQLRARAAALLPPDTLASLPSGDNHASRSVEQGGDDVAEPFLALRRDEENVKLFMHLFRGRDDAFARQWSDRSREKQGYVPVRRSLMPADIQDHLAGHKTYGIYLLSADSRVHTGVIDVDLQKALRTPAEYKKHKPNIRREIIYLHQRIGELAQKHNLTCIAEVSGGKGYHFWFPLDEPADASIMRRALHQLTAGLAEDINCFTLEIFPKQDRISGKGFGNLVKLPLGIHRGSGKPSWLVRAKNREKVSQFEYLRTLTPSKPESLMHLAGTQKKADIIVHPRHVKWAETFPELAVLESRCAMLGQIAANARSGRTLSIREEKILFGTLAHLPRGSFLLHHIFAELPEYNRPLLDYKISRVRGSVLGCKRIHSLLEQHSSNLPCRFRINDGGYAHPLRHVDDFQEPGPRTEKVVNLKDALTCLQTAVKQVERFM